MKEMPFPLLKSILMETSFQTKSSISKGRPFQMLVCDLWKEDQALFAFFTSFNVSFFLTKLLVLSVVG
jgi:hypothetical protein